MPANKNGKKRWGKKVMRYAGRKRRGGKLYFFPGCSRTELGDGPRNPSPAAPAMRPAA